MIGILIIAHGNLGESLIQCATHVLNKVPPRVVALGVSAKDDPALLLPHAISMVRELDNGSGVLVLTDMYGGSPSNMASKVVVPGRVEAVCGINLPMLIKLASLKGAANLLVMPTLDAANIAFNLLKTVAGDGLTVGPMLLGAARPVHILTPTATVRRIINVTALLSVEAAQQQNRLVP